MGTALMPPSPVRNGQLSLHPCTSDVADVSRSDQQGSNSMLCCLFLLAGPGYPAAKAQAALTKFPHRVQEEVDIRVATTPLRTLTNNSSTPYIASWPFSSRTIRRVQTGDVLTAPKLKKHTPNFPAKYILGCNRNWKSKQQLHKPYSIPGNCLTHFHAHDPPFSENQRRSDLSLSPSASPPPHRGPTKGPCPLDGVQMLKEHGSAQIAAA